MKKRHLRNWVKTTLVAIAVIGVFVVLNNQYDKAVNECVSNGQSYEVCVNGLR